ncbi:hypothetical protein BCR33DRAFT_233619 [Rhizoclosmatium globosum]|uniref:Uncharacterized protein n=1 Tax=Rhizoclosmatium globosum TaxID=329046 RepID=A0A1Y2CAH1_9FUNG|nr:hypothetical protein BCR33DRAFT_233619 [Rhizoclosmatium globosum]|eukprot:ORY44033.1 hypothetical protein BCR33DRAFT_233619 [Rhizoclosmatium globosum]
MTDKLTQRPVQCKPMAGIKIFRIKSSPWNLLWSVWNGGVCYMNQVRKTTWLSIATLGKVHAIPITSTTKAILKQGKNQVSISDSVRRSFKLIFEFDDDKQARTFICEFESNKVQLLESMKVQD